MKSFLLVLSFLVLATSGLARLKPSLTYRTARDMAEVEQIASVWRDANPDNCASRGGKGISMLPFLHDNDPKEWMLLERCTKQKFAVGMVVRAMEHNNPLQLTQHMILNVSADGESVFLIGCNNMKPDGWFPRAFVFSIVRQVIQIAP